LKGGRDIAGAQSEEQDGKYCQIRTIMSRMMALHSQADSCLRGVDLNLNN
jgi:hypothetical protein